MKFGFVALIGRPNVGKSTLLNRLVGQKLAIVTPKPQTTRDAIRGILTRPDAQIVFLDTPGLHVPRDPLGRYMVRCAQRSSGDADLACLMVEPAAAADADCASLALLRGCRSPLFLLINKTDTVRKEALLPVIESYRGLLPFREIIPLSARTGDGVERLLRAAIELLPEGEKLFPDDFLSDQPTRFAVGEMIREKVFSFLHQEVPYGTAVRMEGMKDREDGVTVVTATIVAERESHKGMLVGRGGAMIKRIGTAARRDIEEFLGRRVFLDLRVRVVKDWKRDEELLRKLGYVQ
ncbi:MAG: GTPase Era [Candidatus Aureabacteria bacterium]|nr:GTPase Era [Candidatus Auribacterota bacterium]HOE26749.1 GTPase Era [bacterium]HQM51730.1 GTPase Era [bacterium]